MLDNILDLPKTAFEIQNLEDLNRGFWRRLTCENHHSGAKAPKLATLATASPTKKITHRLSKDIKRTCFRIYPHCSEVSTTLENMKIVLFFGIFLALALAGNYIKIFLIFKCTI